MNVEALGLEPSEAVGDGLESFPYGVEMVESFLQAEVAQVIGAKLVAEEAGELLVLFEEGVLPVGAEDVMAMLDLIDDRGQFPMQSFVQAHAEDLADPIRRQTPEADFTASFEDLVNREVTLENEIPAVLDLGDGVEAGQADLLALLLGKLWPQDQGPVIELFANDGRTQPIGRCLQRRHIVHGKEGVVVLAETDFGALQFLFHEGVAVEPVRCMEREKTGYTDNDRSQNFIADVEVVMGEAAPLLCQNSVIGILGGILRDGDAEGAALFHAFEEEVDPVSVGLLHLAQSGKDVILFADSLFGPLDGDVVVAGVSLHPVLVVVGALAEHLLVHHRQAENVVEEIDDLFGPGQTTQVAMNDHTVEAVVYKNQQAGIQLCEKFHRSSLLDRFLTTRSSVRRPVESKFQICLARIETMIRGVCEPARLLDLIENFTIFSE